MRSNFEACLAQVFAHEGGYVNDPHDPGGETNYGISKRSYPKENIKGMTRARAGEIYRRDYWNAVRGDDLPAGLDLVAFDAAVNSGVSRGAKWVQRAVGAVQDGKVGPETVRLANVIDPRQAVNQACDHRLQFLQGLPGWPRYKNGWSRRVAEVRAAAVEMATKWPVAPQTPAPNPSTPAVSGQGKGLIYIIAALAAAVAAYLGVK